MLVLDEWGRGGQHFSLRLVEAKGLTFKKNPKQIEVAEHNGQQRFSFYSAKSYMAFGSLLIGHRCHVFVLALQ